MTSGEGIFFDLRGVQPGISFARPRIEHLQRAVLRRIVLNLAAVSDLDAAGVGELVHLFNMAATAHSELRIANARPRVRELLDRARVFNLLTGDARWWPQAV